MDRQKANFLVIELVDSKKIKYLGKNLAYKKIYQLIDNAIEVQYYCNEVKN